jgi:sporulation protein YlmC with PRC-barrel domain
MPEHDLDTILDWRGRTVVDRKGEKLGKVGDLYLDEATDRPAYAGVRTGLLGRHESIVPLEGIQERDDELVVPHDAELVRDAPTLDPDAGVLDDDAQQRLARHYRTDAGPATRGSAAADAAPEPQSRGDESSAEMIRSEEEVVTGTTPPRPTERVRIRKVLVTDHVKRTVPVRREEIRLETEPPPEGVIESVHDAGEVTDR